MPKVKKQVIITTQEPTKPQPEIVENIIEQPTTRANPSFEDALKTLKELGFNITHPRIQNEEKINVDIEKPIEDEKPKKIKPQKVVIKKKTDIQKKIPKKREEKEETEYEEEAVKEPEPIPIKKEQIAPPPVQTIKPQPIINLPVSQPPPSQPVHSGLGANPFARRFNPFNLV